MSYSPLSPTPIPLEAPGPDAPEGILRMQPPASAG